jgi:cytochrome P450
MEGAAHGLAEMTDYITALSQERHLQPREDLLTGLVTVVDEGNRLSQEELVANVSLLLAAGHETTTNLIGNGMLALVHNPDQMQKLRDNPTAEDVEMEGKRIGQGQLVNLVVGAANRDPARFSDPDRFDITRHEGRHVGLGLGIHFCLGAALARLEGEIAFTTLLRRFSEFQLATDSLEWQEHPTFRGLKSLPVTFRT